MPLIALKLNYLARNISSLWKSYAIVDHGKNFQILPSAIAFLLRTALLLWHIKYFLRNPTATTSNFLPPLDEVKFTRAHEISGRLQRIALDICTNSNTVGVCRMMIIIWMFLAFILFRDSVFVALKMRSIEYPENEILYTLATPNSWRFVQE